jgi:ferredoxin
MAEYAASKTIRIVYFSGTGGTKIAAEKLAESFTGFGVTVIQQELNAQEQQDRQTKEDLLIVLYPVYALNAPEPVYKYINNHDVAENIPAAIISISGGGEVTPNKACRRRVIKLLENKGYRVVYEKMLIMPSNIFTATPLNASVRLLKVLPVKASQIAGDLLGGVVCRTRPGLINTALSAFGELEKIGARQFGRHIASSADCTGCGICAAHCPVGNIRMAGGRPVYGGKCITCMKCLYGCPQKALKPGFGKFFMVKEGYNLADIVRAAADGTGCGADQAQYDAREIKGISWAGVRRYLEEKD